MHFIKMFCLAAVAATFTIAVAGATSANASAMLCHVNESPCSEENMFLHPILNTPEEKTWAGTRLLCLNRIELWFDWAYYLFYINCGTTAAHNECRVFAENQTEEKGGEVTLTLTGKNEGQVEVLEGATHIECTVFKIIKIDCIYDEEGLTYSVHGAEGKSHGWTDSTGLVLEKTSGGSLCPGSEEITKGVEEFKENAYVTE